jgi:hypothetical protein
MVFEKKEMTDSLIYIPPHHPLTVKPIPASLNGTPTEAALCLTTITNGFM